ncbi:MAG TPA: N-acetylneuraminate synthase [Vicinamibacterales bacterium]|nr:N-acetylneuraminate synthase [Vicinamibacterales bacterium]
MITIADRRIGDGHPTFVIAEAGVNHNGDLSRALLLVDEAAAAGADAVKFQTFSAERVAAATAPKAVYQQETTGSAGSQLDMLRGLELSRDAHCSLQDRCRERGVIFLSTPFDESSVDLLESLGVPAFKIPSGEITNAPLLEHIAAKGRPVIASTGMSTLEEVQAAIAVLRAAGARELALLHCVSEYPARPADVNLRAMETMRRATGLPVGYSDHTLGVEVALAAVALGAVIIEKHFTISRALPGPDHRASLEPHELHALIRGIRSVQSALGHGRKEPAPGEADVARVARRSLVAARDIHPGTTITRDMVAILRPAGGLSPMMLGQVIGRRAVIKIQAGEQLSMAGLEG